MEATRGRDGRAKSTRTDCRGNREMGKARPGSATFGTTWPGMCGDITPAPIPAHVIFTSVAKAEDRPGVIPVL